MGIGGMSTARKVKGQEATVSTHVKSLPTPDGDDGYDGDGGGDMTEREM